MDRMCFCHVCYLSRTLTTMFPSQHEDNLGSSLAIFLYITKMSYVHISKRAMHHKKLKTYQFLHLFSHSQTLSASLQAIALFFT